MDDKTREVRDLLNQVIVSLGQSIQLAKAMAAGCVEGGGQRDASVNLAEDPRR